MTSSLDNTSRRTRSRLDLVANFLSYILLAISLAVLIYAICCVKLAYSPLLWVDQWVFLQGMVNNHGHYNASLLWQPHNEHRIPLPKLFYLADLYLFCGRNLFLLVCVFVIQFSTLLWLILAYVRIGRMSGAALRTAISITIICLFTMKQSENFWFGWNLAMILPFLGAAMTFTGVGFLCCQFRQHNKTSILPLLLTWGGVVIALMSQAYGLLLWPVLLVTIAACRLPARLILWTAALCIGLTAAWFIGYPMHSSQHSFPPALQMLQFIQLLFGSSWSYVSTKLGVVLASLAVPAVILAYIWCVIIRRGHDIFSAVFLSIANYVIACSLLIAFGRVQFGIQYAFTERYQTGILLFWACVVALLVRQATSASPGRWPWLLSLQLILTVVLVLGAKILPQVLNGARIYRSTIRGAEVALHEGVNDSAAIMYVTIPPFHSEDILRLSDFLRLRHWSIFADDKQYPLGQEFQPSYKIVSAQACMGALDKTSMIQDPERSEIKFTGWAYDVAARKRARAVALVKLDGRFVAVGQTGFLRSDVPAAVPGIKRNDTGYVGYVAAQAGLKRARAYAILDDGVSACALPESRSSQINWGN